ncbi:MAG: ABC transporter permease [Anaerolineales bacterium]|nr:ABC transporter permease [Anaerolineales bacterium]
MRPRWRKVISDLFDNKVRTTLVVISIAVGVLAVGVIAGSYVIIENDMSASYAANNPANIEIRTSNFEENFLNTVRNVKGIKQAEARRVFDLRVRPLGETQWTNLDIIVMQDYDKNEINLLSPVEGNLSPRKEEIVLEKDVLDEFDIQVGQTLQVQLRDETVKELTVVGITVDASTGAVDFLAPPMAFIHRDTLSMLGQPELYNRIYATVENNGQDDEAHIRAVLADLKDKVEKSGYGVGRTWVAKTHEHPLAATVNAILGILMALGVLIVFLSSSLIANTLSALLNQHLRHIGVMKLIGARDKQIFGMYLTLILSFGLLALLIAIPLGGRGAYALAQYIAGTLGFSLLGYRIVPISFIIQVAIGILVPLVAGLVPVVNGSRVTVLRAISGDLARDAGEQAEEGAKHESRMERFQLRATQALVDRGIRIPRPLLISLRNTFRRRGRLMLTLFTLTMGGAIFVSVFNVRVTLHDYVKDVGNYFLADVTISFEQPYRLNEIRQFVMTNPNVTWVEGWSFASAEILKPDGSSAENMDILAPPAKSQLVSPLLVDGRWILPTDKKKFAISESVYNIYPDLQTGDSILLKINGREEHWEVVGVFKFVGIEGTIAYATYEYISREQNLANRSYSYRIVTNQHDRDYQEAMAKEMDSFFVGNREEASCKEMVETMMHRVVNRLLHCVIKNINYVSNEYGPSEAVKFVDSIVEQAKEALADKENNGNE